MYDVKNSYVHPRYISKSKVHDVGLVQLYSPLRFSARVLPIRLVAKQTRLKASMPAIVSGWGKLKVRTVSTNKLSTGYKGFPTHGNMHSQGLKTTLDLSYFNKNIILVVVFQEGGPSATYLQSTTIETIAMKLCKSSGLDRKAIDPQSMFCAGSFSQPSPDACQVPKHART